MLNKEESAKLFKRLNGFDIKDYIKKDIGVFERSISVRYGIDPDFKNQVEENGKFNAILNYIINEKLYYGVFPEAKLEKEVHNQFDYYKIKGQFMYGEQNYYYEISFFDTITVKKNPKWKAYDTILDKDFSKNEATKLWNV
jgi:hypothetical protein